MKRQAFYWLLTCIAITICIFSLTSCECEHEWKKATCISPKTCMKCGKTIGDSSTIHDYTRVECEEYLRCSTCGATSTYKAKHSYTGECEKIGSCYYCGKASPNPIEHHWKGNIHTGALSCENCDRSISETDIQGKKTSDLTETERAYIYWHLNRYLTALTSYGSYVYTTDEAFQKAATQFHLSKSYLKDDFWGVNSMPNHNCYSKYYYN